MATVKHDKKDLILIDRVREQGGTTQDDRNQLVNLYIKYVDPSATYLCRTCRDGIEDVWEKLTDYISKNQNKFN